MTEEPVEEKVTKERLPPRSLFWQHEHGSTFALPTLHFPPTRSLGSLWDRYPKTQGYDRDRKSEWHDTIDL